MKKQNTKNKAYNKSGGKQNGRLAADKAAVSARRAYRRKVARVCTGMVFLFLALFLVASFSSYLYSGAQDFSYCEGQLAGSDLTDTSYRVRNVGGKLGAQVSYFFINSCFGVSSYAIPAFLAMLGLNLIGSFRFRLVKDFVKLSLLMVWLSVVLAVVAEWIPNIDESHINLGGNHGKYVHSVLLSSVGDIGEYLLIGLSVLFVLIYMSVRTADLITEFFKFNRLRAAIRKRKESAGAVSDSAEDQDAGYAEPVNEALASHGEEPLCEHADGTDAAAAAPSSAATELGGNVIDLTDLPPSPAGGDSHEEPPAADVPALAGIPSSQPPHGADTTDNAPDFTVDAVNETERGTGDILREEPLKPFDPRASLSRYEFPPLSLLDGGSDDSVPTVDMTEQQANKDRIIKVLKSFGVEISTIRATIGPTITLYEITPAEGTRIAKIRNLEDDIALSLAAEGIRIIAPIPGKGTIGIEVPNKKKCIVSMRSVLDSRTFKESTMELPCVLGKTITNEVYMVDLAKAPHMLVAGATGMGKSVGLNAIVTSLLYKKHPSELKMVMVDPKKVEFSIYAPIANQFLAKLEDEEDSIITDNQRVVKTLNGLCKLMDDRYMLLKKAQVRNIKEYNAKFKERKLNPEDGHEFMPYYVVVIDEFGDLIMTAGKEIELPICRIAQLARAVGIHMIIATQRPTTRIITGTIKANFPARMAFRVAAMMDSRIILDRPGANQLIGRGDMLYLQGNDPVRVQCAYVDTPEVARICKFISEQQQFLSQTFLPDPPMDDASGDKKEVDLNHLDPLFPEVARMVVGSNAGSTSAIQRKFEIGYNRAGRLMDQLEQAGIVGSQIGSKPREVLINDLLALDSVLSSLGVS